MKRKILIIGSDGLVGSRFMELSNYKNQFLAPSISEFDITREESIKHYLLNNNVEVVVNFAAFTSVDQAETQRGNKDGMCWKINVTGVESIAKNIDSRKTHFIQISTDMVFSGSVDNPGPYNETSQIEKDLNKLTWYGYSKGIGEGILKDYLGQSFSILRLIYPVRSHFEAKLDYIRKPLKLYIENNLYPLFSDQNISITFIDHMCLILDSLIQDRRFGTFHSSSSDITTPFDLIRSTIGKLKYVKDSVKSINLDDFVKNNNYPIYRYPKYGGLKSNDTDKALNIKPISVNEIIDTLVNQELGSEYMRNMP